MLANRNGDGKAGSNESLLFEGPSTRLESGVEDIRHDLVVSI